MTKLFCLILLATSFALPALAHGADCGTYTTFVHSVDRWGMSAYIDARSGRDAKSNLKFVKSARSALKASRWALKDSVSVAWSEADRAQLNELTSKVESFIKEAKKIKSATPEAAERADELLTFVYSTLSSRIDFMAAYDPSFKKCL